MEAITKKAAAEKEAAKAAAEEKAFAVQNAKSAVPAPAPAPVPAPTPVAVPAPTPVPPAAATPSGGVGVITGSASGGRILPKEEVSADLLNMLKKYN